jgi:phosphopentomutase
MAEASPGKDSITGHWELAGLVLDRPFPTFPHGFPPDVIAAFERRIGRPTIGNVVASGTVVLDDLGPEHVRTGAPIVYTSADSVFQLAAHEDVVPVDELYAMCEQAFELVSRGLGVARVIARPFTGAPGAYTRTANRHDFALAPTGDTLLDSLSAAGVQTLAVGKVHDLFAGRGIARHWPSATDEEGMRHVLARMADSRAGLIFANLVDFDTVFGHRNDVQGYAANLERFDAALGRVLDALTPSDLLVITSDHGNDPTTASTDHSREYVPLMAAGALVRAAALGTRPTFADLAQTLAANFGVGPLRHGSSFLEEIVVQHS